MDVNVGNKLGNYDLSVITNLTFEAFISLTMNKFELLINSMQDSKFMGLLGTLKIFLRDI